MEIHAILWQVFGIIILGFLALDLGYFNRVEHKITTKGALVQSIFWIAISLAYAGLIWATLGHIPAIEFTSAYVTEKMLSVDNLFVILLIFRFFKVEEKFYHRVLFWGIFGAIFFRALFIGAGAVVIEHFHWVLYIFGVVLLYSGFKLLTSKEDEYHDIREGRMFKLLTKYMPVDLNNRTHAFIGSSGGKWAITLLGVVLIMVETTDIVFAFDSIPAVFAITQDPFLVFTSNIFAIMGLRSLFFLVENILTKFHYLQKGLSFVLVFIGAKMLLPWHINPIVSLVVVLGTLGASVLLSMLFPKTYDK